MIEIYTSKKCQPCATARVAFQMHDIEFVENPRSSRVMCGALPFIYNTDNDKFCNGWLGSFKKVADVLGLDVGE